MKVQTRILPQQLEDRILSFGLRMSFWILCVLYLSLSAALYAQQPDIKFDHVFDLGVPGGQTMLQDNDGFLWVGSEGAGIFRWDGYELKNYGVGPELLSNGTIFRILADRENPDIFWIATAGGLNRFDKGTETFRHYTHDPNNPNSVSDGALNDIVQDGNDMDTLWLGIGAGGMNKFHKKTGTFTRYDVYSDGKNIPEVWRIFEDKADPNILWLGAWGTGLNKFEKNTGTFTSYIHDPNDLKSYGDTKNLVGAIAQDKDDSNILWVGTVTGGLDKFDKRVGTFAHYVHNPYASDSIMKGTIGLIYDDGSGVLWLGGFIDNNGLTVFDKQTESFRNYKHEPRNPYSLSHDSIVNVHADRSGVYWITTFSGKIDKYDKWNQNFELYKKLPNNTQSLSDNSVITIYEDRDGMMWFGTQKGLNQFDMESGTFSIYRHDPDDHDSLAGDYILGLYEDSDRVFWVALFNGPLAKFDKKNGRVLAHYNTEAESFTKILEDPVNPNILWLGTRLKGFAKFEKTSETFTFYPQNKEQPDHGVDNDYIYEVLPDTHEDVIWLGGIYGGGLNRFDKHTETFTHYKKDPDNPGSISADAIATIYQDSTDVLWIGTLGGGLNKFYKDTERFIHYAEQHGIPSDVLSILEDERGNLWLSTNVGIVKFDPRTEIVEKQYRQSDGLQCDVFLPRSGLKTRSGEMWFGGTNGVNSFYPELLTTNSYKPPVVLTSLTQGGELINWENNKIPQRLQKISLDWRHNFFEFEYAALNFTNPAKNQYKYKLEGFDRDWYKAGTERKGRYSGLHAGSYLLRIIGSNNDGVWNEEGTSLKVVVTPSFWETWWFKNAIAILMVVAVAGGIMWRVNTIEAHRRQLEIQVAGRTKQLRGERDKAQKYLDIVGVIIVVIGADYTVKLINKRGCEILGGTEQDILGKNWFDCFLPGHVRDEVKTVFSSLMKEEIEPAEYFENPILTLTGEECMIAWHNTLLRDENGAITAALASGEDITERNQMEIRLQAAKSEAEAANQAKSEFLARMSHELRTPLNGILGYTQILKRDIGLTATHQEQIDIIHRSGEYLLMMISDILDLSKIEARKMELEPVEFHLSNFLKSLIEIARIRAHNKGITLEEVLEPGLPTVVSADEKRLRQVLLNLLSNAIKFTQEGGVTLRVANSESASGNPQPAIRLLFEIEDTGIGIPPEHLDQIFSAFHQVHDTRSQIEGTGLGLAISQQLVKLMGSELHVESTPGQGSTFWFELELPIAEEKRHKQENTPENHQIVGFSGASRTVLIADDKISNRSVLRDMLTPLGFTIVEATDGQDALHKAEDVHPDLILMDLVMSGMDGFEATQRLRQRADLKDIVVIAISASVFEQTRQKSQQAGCDDYLAKPFRRENLLELLQQYLKLEWLYQEEKSSQEPLLASEERSIILPPQESLTELYEILMSGDIETLLERTQQLEQRDKKFVPFVTKICLMAKEFRLEDIREFLQQHITET